MITRKYPLFGKCLLTSGAMLMLLASMAVLRPEMPTASAQSNSLSGAIVDVGPLSSLKNAVEGTGPFYIEAPVFDPVPNLALSNCASLASSSSRSGTLRIWGFRTGAQPQSEVDEQRTNVTAGVLAVVNMSLDFSSCGSSIEMQGTLGRVRQNALATANPQDLDAVIFDVVAVTGGTGRFRGASGEAVLTPFFTSDGNNCANGAFRLSFQRLRNR